MADFRLPISSTSTHKSVNPNSLTFTNTGTGTGTTSYNGSDTVSIDLSKIAASTAEKATADADGNTISSTYIKKAIGTTKGDIIYWSAKDTPARLGIGTNGYFLAIAEGVPAWSALPIATAATVGVTKIGTGLDVTADGTISITYGTNENTALEGNTIVNKVKQSSSTTNAAYKLLLTTEVSPTSGNNYETLYSTNLTYNPSTKALVTGGTVNGLTLTAASTGFTIKGGTTAKTLTVNADYTLAAACAKAVTDSSSASAISTGTSLVTERDVYYGLPTINGAHTYTSSTTLFAPTAVGTSGQFLKSSGSGAPSWSALPTASTTAAGIVQLSSSTESNSTTLAATASAVKAAYDLANGKTSNTGTVTSITISATSPVAVSATGAITTSGTRTISLSDAYGDTKNPYGTKTANYVLAGPSSGDAAAPAFRALVAADIPALAASKITSGTFDAARIPSLSTDKLTSGTLPVGRGGTGQTSIANIQAGKDGDGNTISSTYLKLSGGTMTGTITTHGLKGTLNVDYGDTLPSSPAEGQIFFQLSDPQYELPTGGTTGQALIKSSNSDRDVTWGSVTVDDRVAKAGDTMTGQLCSANTGGQWILGRDNALIRHTTAIDSSSFSPIFSSKTVLGSWEAGPCHPNEDFLFSYATDTNYNNSTNVTQHNIRFTASGQVYGAVWNDYAEMRRTIKDIKPGSCVYEIGDDTMAPTYQRLQKGCKIVSDTFGFNIGETDTAKTPIAVAGRALVYLLEGREAAKNAIGEFVCSGPNGTVSIMTTEEYLQNPQAVVGTISSVPDYEEWGSGNIKVNGRIWIYVR